MKAKHLYIELKEVAERLGIIVREQNFRTSGIRTSSGLCKVRGQAMFFLDKFQKLQDKNRLLAECLSEMAIEEIYIVPAVREAILQHRPAAIRPSRQKKDLSPQANE